MAKFKDATGREWTIAIPDFTAVIRLREAGVIDLNKVGNDSGALFDLLHGDAEAMIRIAHTISGSTEPVETLLAAVTAEVLDDIREAVLGAIVDFFHHRRAAEIMKGRLAAVMLGKIAGSNATDVNSPVTSV